MSGIGDTVRQWFSERDVQRLFLVLTVVSVVFFAAFTGRAFANFSSYYRNVYPHASFSSPVGIILGIGILVAGLLARRHAYSLFGLAWILYGAASGIPRLQLGLAWSRRPMLILLIGSVVSCGISLVAQLRDRAR